MSHMKKVTLREFRHNSRYQRMAHDGHPVLVTNRGKPYFVALPPDKVPTFLGAARAGGALTRKLLDSVLNEEGIGGESPALADLRPSSRH
jgi:antitoxin (DNA-binding transcriptional repressor) of toxin-antitoxin stability system